MEFTLFKGFGLREAISRLNSSSELDGLSDRLRRDIGYSPEGRPLDSEGTPHGRPSRDAIELLSPALLLLTLH